MSDDDAIGEDSTASEWPDHFPAGCPPQSAVEAHGKPIYRLVRKLPPAPHDFRSHWELGASKDADPCQRCGLSCALETESLERLRAAIPRRRTNAIVAASLPEGYGVILQTGAPAHYTLWIRAEHQSSLHSLFAPA